MAKGKYLYHYYSLLDAQTSKKKNGSYGLYEKDLLILYFLYVIHKRIYKIMYVLYV